MTDIAISVQNLSKCYQIYDTPRDRLRQFVIPRLLRMTGQATRQYYREFWALKDVSFEIKKGETVGIVGRNGSGKSTLLQLICGTLNPTAGLIWTQGRIAALLELGSGFNPEFTGRENVLMSCALLGLSPKDIEAKFDDIAAFADIGDFIEQPVKTYSSGMFVRLAFAVNIVSEPDIMIVDEALAVGDMAFQSKCMSSLKRIQESGATVLFVSHDIGSIKSLCSRSIYLEHGTVRAIGQAGSVADLYIRAMREEMNTAHATSSKTATSMPLQNTGQLSHTTPSLSREFKISAEFDARTADFRYGEGGARITFAELLDENSQPINTVEFDQTVFIRIYFESAIEGELSCNYYVADSKKNLILGAGLRLAGQPSMHVRMGEKYAVAYKTRLPLEEGNYSIQLQITETVVQDEAAKFLDVIQDAIVFRVLRRQGVRIWTKAYVANEVEIESC